MNTPWLDLITKHGDPLTQARAALAGGMDPAVRVEDGFFLVHRLLLEKNPEQYSETIKLLLHKANNIEMVDDYGWSVLSIVSFHGDRLLDLTRWMLDNGADPVSKNAPRSPLFRALDGRKPFYSQGQDPELTQSFEMLMNRAGPEALKIRDRHGRTLFELARCRSDDAACDVIEECRRRWKSQERREHLMGLARHLGSLPPVGEGFVEANPLM